jgi:hypothetical protein
MSRNLLLAIGLASTLLFGSIASATIIPVDDLDPMRSPCSLTLSQSDLTRTLQWSAVPGATSYKIGYRTCDGTLIGIAEVTGTSYFHVGWNPGECMDYVMVAYSGNENICSAIREDSGNCPCH